MCRVGHVMLFYKKQFGLICLVWFLKIAFLTLKTLGHCIGKHKHLSCLVSSLVTVS